MSSAAKKHYENGLKLFKSGKLPEAEASLAEAIALDEQNAEYWVKLGLIWSKQARHTEARDAYQMALTLQPTNADAYYNLGLTCFEVGEINDGITLIEKSFSMRPNKALAEELGEYFFKKGNFKLASYYYLKARQLDTKDADLQAKLATALYSDGDTIGAIILNIDLVSRFPTNRNYISALVDMYRKFDHTSFDELAYKVLLICLKTENIKYRYLGPAWASLMLLNPALEGLRGLATATAPVDLNTIRDQLSNEFLTIGLKNLPILNINAEKVITGIRRYFMVHYKDASRWPKEALEFLTAMSVQSWYNDFVLYESDEEKSALPEVEEKVRAIAASGTEAGLEDAILIALYGCYRPLYGIKEQGKKLPVAKSFLYEMRPLIKAQIQNPEREAEIIPTIPAFTEITDDTSRAVQDMYAKRPYPRWRSAGINDLPPGLAEHTRGIQILVAGCGTGQEPSLYANSTPHAHITAIDLSRPSIAYGMRMAEEVGYLDKIDFMHGDLMEVAKIGRSFDLVVSSGVLHHMKDPEKGWKAILDTMKTGGRMAISLYSKIARDYALNPASEYIREKGYSSSDEDIRQFRRDVMNMPDDSPVRRCIRASDFFMLSECNDLLFHIQEHRMTFPVLKEMTERLGLELVHIYMPPKTLKAWNEKFPDRANSFDFDRLHEFEQENVDAFIEMYKMYFRRKGDTSNTILDSLMKAGII